MPLRRESVRMRNKMAAAKPKNSQEEEEDAPSPGSCRDEEQYGCCFAEALDR